MNILVQPYGSERCYCRPDTTWERENKDFYSPESVNQLHWTPVVFVRISKAGKCIGEKFASRYYDGFGFGALLYIGETLPDIAISSCADHSSRLPFPLYNPVVMEGNDNIYDITKNGNSIFNCNTEGVKEKVEKAICTASRLTSLRIGDFVAVELAAISPLVCREDGDTSIKAIFCENDLYDFRLVF